ncbi:DUF4314 domain-containing protein [Amycolatopsis rubida]|uniref:DUF4314 domain-containing protein n=1 Tax=Amycolatopsis rubida TaxID=112413 RepID=A0A1I5DZX6_9PSEU|nr:DUF4314 domain-containing protein [Amycolatopsis rubida]SFO04693.1 protein of unknown function [Amycolatopsis rubida]
MGKYARGQRVVLVRINDEDTDLKPGDKGTYLATDALGTLLIKWDCGSTLGIVPEAGDKVEPIDEGQAATTA